MADDPQVGDFIVLFDSESDDAHEPPILLVRMTEEGYEGIGEAWIDQADRMEERARSLAHEAGARAWRHVGEGYTLLLPLAPGKDVH